MGGIYAAIVILSITAVFGIYLFSLIVRNKSRPKGLTIIHGLLAFTALIFLIIYYCRHSPGPLDSIVLFCLAATGGFVLNYRDITGKTVPKWLGLVHGLIAVCGFVLLLIFAFSHSS